MTHVASAARAAPCYVLDYWREIESGREIVSKRVYQLYRNLSKDITSPAPESPYTFDAEKALRPIEYIEAVCKHSKGK